MKLMLLIVLFVVSAQFTLAKDFTPSECPVVGNTKSKIYHVSGNASYEKMPTAVSIQNLKKQ